MQLHWNYVLDIYVLLLEIYMKLYWNYVLDNREI